MARLIGELCDKVLPDQKWPLVGGLLLLRLYCPTLISPTTFGLLPSDYVVPAALRKVLPSPHCVCVCVWRCLTARRT